jgi:hypothetical protein
MAIILGIILILLGIKVCYNPIFYDPLYQTTFDLRGYHIPLGIAMILSGIGFLWTSWTSRKKKQK